MRKWINHLALKVNTFMHLRLDTIKFCMDKFNPLNIKGIAL